ncbi:hypothetical protein EVAR_9560_1 [Eumeta japonica]|uniref:Uncharacterized protein n=1 Tax=Eumeta variegata TaxID=151549 RepID=A0A4C1U4D9_EUMVA|nr:hypothetical protein EVAR_9560_1 [Eumeta japonica]
MTTKNDFYERRRRLPVPFRFPVSATGASGTRERRLRGGQKAPGGMTARARPRGVVGRVSTFCHVINLLRGTIKAARSHISSRRGVRGGLFVARRPRRSLLAIETSEPEDGRRGAPPWERRERPRPAETFCEAFTTVPGRRMIGGSDERTVRVPVSCQFVL